MAFFLFFVNKPSFFRATSTVSKQVAGVGYLVPVSRRVCDFVLQLSRAEPELVGLSLGILLATV
jgi:hypothetical protein